jgi:hypothetical protein
MQVRHISVGINRTFDEVYGFLSEPINFEKWASGLGNGLRHLGGRLWRAESPEGGITVRFTDLNPYGVLDHEVETPTGERILNPMRVIPNGSGSEVVFTLLQRPGVSDATFEADAKWVSRDLEALKGLLE